MKYGLKMISSADGTFVFNEGVWLKAYDPDANEGAGDFEVTDDLSEALAFPNAGDAMEVWRKVSTVKPLRTDGKLNRPLSAFTVSIEPITSEPQ